MNVRGRLQKGEQFSTTSPENMKGLWERAMKFMALQLSKEIKACEKQLREVHQYAFDGRDDEMSDARADMEDEFLTEQIGEAKEKLLKLYSELKKNKKKQ